MEDSGIDVNLGSKLPGEFLLKEHVSEREDNYSESEDSSNHHQSSITSDQEHLERLSYQAEEIEGCKSKIVVIDLKRAKNLSNPFFLAFVFRK